MDIEIIPITLAEDPESQEAFAFDELRKLLIGPEQNQLVEIKQKLEDPGRDVKAVSRVLPEAIMLRSAQDKKIAKALEPILEESIKTSVEKNPRALVNALFPIMLPTIRRAISSMIFGMIQSLNQSLTYSCSMRGLKWRLEALKTKKSFGEVVLLHTLIYQVEQIFLIHRDTGVVLQHVAAKNVASQDPDLVSGMLTAIQQFMQDSFMTEKGETIETLRIGGNHSLWLEDGPQAVLAASIQGTPPLEFRSVLRETLEEIHIKQNEALSTFNGDIATFKPIKSDLESCLQSQYQGKEQKISPLLWILLAGIVFFITAWSFYAVRDYQRWTRYLQKLRDEPGLVVTNTEKRSGDHYIYGLRDPLAQDPAEILKESGLDPEKVIAQWETYHALYPEFILTRARKLLQPPETVSMNFLRGTLTATGAAPHQWITEAKKFARMLPGVVEFQGDTLIDIDRKEFDTIKENIEAHLLLFEHRIAELAPNQSIAQQVLVTYLDDLFRLADLLGEQIQIEITGHTDSTGTEKNNLRLSRARAEHTLHFLVSHHFKQNIFITSWVGSKEPLKEELTDLDRSFNRCVTFRVIMQHNER